MPRVNQAFPYQCIHQLFEAQVKKTPHKVALRANYEEITYHQLNHQANILANFLKEKGVRRGEVIGVFIETSIEMLVAALAILKAGAAYLPIETSYPDNRIKYMLNQAGVKLVLTQEKLKRKISCNAICVDNENLFSVNAKISLENINDPRDMIYVLFTSGSTGNPKGAILYHYSVSNLLDWYIKEFQFTQEDNILVFSSFSFDLTQKNILGGLISGATVYLVSPEQYDLIYFNELIRKEKITIINCTPSLAYPLIEDSENITKLKSLRYLLLGGEPISTQRLKKMTVLYPETVVVNTYGPTECADITCAYRLTEEDILTNRDVPLGRPIQNIEVIILDEYMQELPFGEIGEIYLGGVGVGGGYINAPELTKKAFIRNDKNEALKKYGEFLYRVGDLGFYHNDGTVQYLGRVDEQIKLHGVRMDLMEIEFRVNQYPGIKQAAVLVKKNNFSEALHCYYVSVDGGEINEEGLKNHLKNFLTLQMIPSSFTCLASFPLTPNGKIDKKHLSNLENVKAERSLVSFPNNALEIALVEIWSGVLKRKKSEIDIDENFYEIGGYSLLAIQICLRVFKQYGYRFTLREFFENPSIRLMANHLAKKITIKNGSHDLIAKKHKAEDSAPLSMTQLCFLRVVEANPGKPVYNLSTAYKLIGKINIDFFKKSIMDIINRHNLLNSVLVQEKNEPRWRYRGSIEEQDFIEEIDKPSILNEQIKNIQDEISQDILRPIDIKKDALLLIKLYKVNEEEWIFSIKIHHIVFDSWSFGIFLHELSNYYNAYQNNTDGHSEDALPIGYMDFSKHEHLYLDRHHVIQSYNYFHAALSNVNFKFWRSSVSTGSVVCKICHDVIENNVVQIIEKLAKEYSLTFFSFFCGAFSILMHDWIKQDEHLLYIPMANRSYQSTEKIIGAFAHSLPMKLCILQKDKLIDHIRSIQEKLLDLFKYANYPFLQLGERLSYNFLELPVPCYKVMFAFQNTPIAEPNFDGLDVELIPVLSSASTYDIEWHIWADKNNYRLEVRYNEENFKESDILKLIVKYKRILLGLDHGITKSDSVLELIDELGEDDD